MVVTNILANILPINNLNTGQVSDSFGNLFAPIGITFAVWGVIYLLLFIYAFYQLFNYQSQNEQHHGLLTKVGVWFSISSIANTIWIFAWHYQVMWLSLILMTVILICLIAINLVLRRIDFDLKHNFLIRVPFTVYFGWITIAMIANVTVFLVAINWNMFGISPELWTITILIIGAIIAFMAILFYHSFVYGFVVIWAYIGIALKHLSPIYFNSQYQGIIMTVYIIIAILVFAEFLLLDKQIKKAKLN